MHGAWITDDHWICARHIRPVRLPASAERCFYANCSQRPPRPAQGAPRSTHAQRHAVRVARGERTVDDAALAAATPAHPTCAWHECDEPARERSKYCSRECSNKNARHRHLARQDKAAPPASKDDPRRHAA
jgi:hypothetical protein